MQRLVGAAMETARYCQCVGDVFLVSCHLGLYIHSGATYQLMRELVAD